MSRRMLSLAAAALLLPGCVLVNEPLSDPQKAEPDPRLLGKWEGNGERKDRCVIDIPAVKGNPKGLMHLRLENSDFWFFVTPVGKHRYWTVFVNEDGFADLSQEGAWERWNRRDVRLYLIAHAELEGDNLTVHGLAEAGEKVLKARFIPSATIKKDNGAESLTYYKTPPGWLAQYLKENGPEDFFAAGGSTWQLVEAAERERAAVVAARKKADEEAARRAEQQRNEEKAASYLRFARKLLERREAEKARARLREILTDEKLSPTEAAKEAKKLLEKLGK